MVGASTALLAALLASAAPVMPVSAGNALTLPAQRHVVRIEVGEGRAPVWLLAVQQGKAEGRGLSLYRSDDGARTFRFLAPIQPDGSHHDRADLVVVGRDVALVYSYESSKLEPSRAHDVWFQWWRYQPGADTWAPEPAVRVFDSPDDRIAYSRALLARDSQGRLWIQAFRLERDGRSTAVVAVSTNEGASFQRQPDLDWVRRRGGGRLLSVGTRLVFVYGMHDGYEPARMRIRQDSDPLDTWGPVTRVFSEGIYHGAALSAVEDGRGGMHFVYKDELQRLYYRHFNGRTFGPRTLLEDTRDWATQSATTRIGDTLYVFYNRMIQHNRRHELRARVLKGGVFSEPVVLDARPTFKGYLNAVAELPEGTAEVPCFFGDAPDSLSRGALARVMLPTQGQGGEKPPPGEEDKPDPGEPPAPGALIFSDDFSRSSREGLGQAWAPQGLWLVHKQRAESDRDGLNLALAQPSRCGDCVVEARVQHFAGGDAAVVLRAQEGARYSLVFLRNGRLQVRREVGGSITVLGEASSGLSSAREAVTLSLLARGEGPVELIASADGQVRLTVVDSSSSALGEPGLAGLATGRAGVWFDGFEVRRPAEPR
jgi:hypothetical protein